MYRASADAAGNMTAEPGKTYTYDAENRMTAGGGVTYTYDGDGKRVAKSNGKLYWYGMSGLDALLETDGAGNNPTEYVFFNGRRVARRDLSGSVFYYFSNHLGSTSVITNASGTIVEESDYYPFGGERVVVNNDPNPYKFTGKERDTETGLDYFGARYHSPTMGRFVSVDPSRLSIDPTDPQTWNRYSYTENRPLTHVDRNGKWSTPLHDYIIDVAFSGVLHHSRIGILKDASEAMDDDLSMSGAPKHGLRKIWQSQQKAMAEGDAFIAGELKEATDAQLGYERDNPALGVGEYFSIKALEHFGNALHTVTDRTSPWHNYHSGVWGPVWLVPGHAAGHGLAEASQGWSQQAALALAVHEARLLWARWQRMLEEARRKEEERKKKEEEEKSKKQEEQQ